MIRTSSRGVSRSAHLIISDRRSGGRSTFQPRSLVALRHERQRALQEADEDLQHEPFEIYTVDLYTLHDITIIHRKPTMEASIALVQNRYLGASPLVPTLAISLKTLELYRRLHLRKPSFSYKAFTKVLCDLYNVLYRQCWRNALVNTYDIFLLLHHQIDAQVRSALGRDTENWRVLHACPPCGYELEGKPKLTFRQMLVLDRNNSLKRIACIDQHEVADSCVYTGSNYFLSPDFVDTFTQDNPPSIVVEHLAPLQTDPEPEADQHEDDAIAKYQVDSTCADNWKAASSNERKRMWELFDKTGIFACACHHGFMLWLTDMVRSGELAKYPLAMVAKALQVLSDRILIGYDIGCSFKSTVASSTLSSQAQAQAQAMRFCVNAFHGYSHSYSCQVNNHPNIIPGMGLKDLETLERVFSSSNQLAAIVCYSSAFRHWLAIDAFFQQWDEDKYLNLRTMILNNYKQALWILNEESIALEEAKKTLGIQPGDLEKWQNEEVAYIAELGKELEADVLAVAYYNITLRDVITLEIKLEIPEGERWHINHPKYWKTLKYKALQDYNKAASALTPPRLPLEWNEVSHYGFLDEFTLLRENCEDILSKPWARPVILREEVERCNIESRHLLTFILDEHDLFDTVEKSLTDSKSLLLAVILVRISQIHALDGFTGDRLYGTVKGTMTS
ncbi:hypothetical protein BDN71DRAFT_1483328 [Pleurotus eryngii]|uniref:CxC1-like cysteine cluster associated with KDZ transposases domain-containing protein n=1 Tax=Pleurotus eryngii TaxID=5323 RepID=A0A9P5ZUA4_PLEER|nr:hypothetical protein BDN71DRAFT_1483328 [Pleurotus eryngii]